MRTACINPSASRTEPTQLLMHPGRAFVTPKHAKWHNSSVPPAMLPLSGLRSNERCSSPLPFSRNLLLSPLGVKKRGVCGAARTRDPTRALLISIFLAVSALLPTSNLIDDHLEHTINSTSTLFPSPIAAVASLAILFLIASR